MSILNNDVNQLEGFFRTTVQRGANAAFMAGRGFYMLVLNPQLASVAFVSPVLIGAFNYWYSRYVEPRHRAIRERVGRIDSRIENNLAGIAIIEANNREAHEAERVADQSRGYRDRSWSIRRVQVPLGQVTSLFTNTGFVLVFLVGGYWVLVGPPPPFGGGLAAGTLLTFLVSNRRFR